METILYEFSFDYVKVIGFFIILVIGVAFFFADKIFEKILRTLLLTQK